MEYVRGAAPCHWGKVVVVMLGGDGCDVSGWDGLMLWQQHQRWNTNLG